jgi:protein-S-isoprenylcysteine O-methyltransferase Ste14
VTIKRYKIPRPLAVATVVVVYGTVNVGAPLALSRFGYRHGWHGRRPSPINLIGVVALVAGAALLVWAAAGHAKAARELNWKVIKFDPDHLLTPDYLVTEGLYSYTRNPLYLADMTMWAGWTVLLGSIPVAVGLTALIVGLQLGLRLEERGLARQFGDRWRRYAARTPRFLGLRRTSRSTN